MHDIPLALIESASGTNRFRHAVAREGERGSAEGRTEKGRGTRVSEIGGKAKRHCWMDEQCCER